MNKYCLQLEPNSSSVFFHVGVMCKEFEMLFFSIFNSHQQQPFHRLNLFFFFTPNISFVRRMLSQMHHFCVLFLSSQTPEHYLYKGGATRHTAFNKKGCTSDTVYYVNHALCLFNSFQYLGKKKDKVSLQELACFFFYIYWSF